MNFLDVIRPMMELQKVAGPLHWNVSCEAGGENQVSIHFWVSDEVAQLMKDAGQMF